MDRASLKRRLVLTFALLFVALAAGVCAIFTVYYDPRYIGAETLAGSVSSGLRATADGRLSVPPGVISAEDARRNPGVWFVARDRRGRILALGDAPADARRLLRALPPPHFAGEESLNFIAADGKPATAQWVQTPAGPATVLAGGLAPGALGLEDWLAASLAVVVTALLPLAVLFLILGLTTVPLVLGALRRLRVEAEAMDGGDLKRRLPEAGTVAELRPVVRAFNGALDRVQAASERRDRMIGDIAHELRTPLAVLTLRTEALEESPAKGELRRGLDRLSQMIGQMLDSERLRAPDRRRERVDLVALTRNAVAGIAPLALAGGYALTFDSEADSVLIDGDGPAIERAVANLLANAVAHAGGSGTIAVRVSAAGAVEVEDAGAGLPAGAHERVFEPFHRERWDKDGCGLGLHLVREVMRAHGGRAEAADGVSGALFRLIFPQPTPA